MPKRAKTFSELSGRRNHMKREARRRYDEQREDWIRSFYQSHRWRECRRRFLQAHPLCGDCEKVGETKLAEEVHHRELKLRNDPGLARAFDWTNLEGLCRAHHNARTRRGE